VKDTFILCDNCEAVRATFSIDRGHGNNIYLCPGCQEAFAEYVPNSIGDEMMMTRDWISYVNPSFIPSKLVIRATALIRAVFPKVPEENWRFIPGLWHGTIALRLDKTISIRLIMSERATTAMIALENPISKLSIIGSVKRQALRNESWLDIFGWVNNARTWYDRRDVKKIEEATHQGGVIDEAELSTPLEQDYCPNEKFGNKTTIKMTFLDEQGKKIELSQEEMKNGDYVIKKDF